MAVSLTPRTACKTTSRWELQKCKIMAKKILILLSVAAMLGLASCTTTINSARTEHFSSPAITMTIADLEVSPKKITYTYRPSDDENRGGEENVINTAVRKALEVNGGGDVLVEMQFTLKKTGKKNVTEVTVSGYPATYKNFRNANEDMLKSAVMMNSLQHDPVKRNKILGIF